MAEPGELFPLPPPPPPAVPLPPRRRHALAAARRPHAQRAGQARRQRGGPPDPARDPGARPGVPRSAHPAGHRPARGVLLRRVHAARVAGPADRDLRAAADAAHGHRAGDRRRLFAGRWLRGLAGLAPPGRDPGRPGLPGGRDRRPLAGDGRHRRPRGGATAAPSRVDLGGPAALLADPRRAVPRRHRHGHRQLGRAARGRVRDGAGR